MTIRTVPEAMTYLAELYRERHVVYGDSEKQFGKLMMILFPNGLGFVKNKHDVGRIAILFHIVDKLIRYSNNFAAGGHVDSLHDIAVYAEMLREYDESVMEGGGD